MTIRRITALILVFSMLLLAGCGTKTQKPSDDVTNPPSDSTETPPDSTDDSPSDEPASPPTEPSQNPTESQPNKENNTVKKKYSILFIGNSYTYYNDMPTEIFKKIAVAAGYEADVTAITKGSHKLSEFADPTDQYGSKVEQALTSGKKYDFVVLQEQSLRPATDDAPLFFDAVRNLTARIKAIGATPILYATWGRKTGSDTLESNGWTNESMTYKLAAAYQAIGDELNISVVHVGLAFYDVYTSQDGIELYHSDKSHPSYAGSYLAAMALFAKIFDTDPTTVNYLGNLPSYHGSPLREAAKKIVFETPNIPSEY